MQLRLLLLAAKNSENRYSKRFSRLDEEIRMFVFGNIIIGIAEVLNILLTVYMWIIVVRALISWVNPDPYNAIVQMLTRITEPVLARIRKLVPPWKIGLDLSPLIAVLIIIFLKYAVVSTLLRIGQSMG